jgi:hypothetical protein
MGTLVDLVYSMFAEQAATVTSHNSDLNQSTSQIEAQPTSGTCGGPSATAFRLEAYDAKPCKLVSDEGQH